MQSPQRVKLYFSSLSSLLPYPCCNVPLRQDQKENQADMLSVHENQDKYAGWMFLFPTGTRDRKAMWSIWHFWCICPLAEAGGRAGYIKPRTNHIFAPQGLGKWLNSRDALPLGKDTSLGYKNPGSVSYTDVEVSLDGRLITPILTHFFSY